MGRPLVLLTVLVTVALLAPAVAAQVARAPLIAPGIELRDLSDEPNVLQPGTVPTRAERYPADANNIARVRYNGESARILGANLAYFCPGQQACTAPYDLLESFQGRDYYLPYYNRVVAWYGDWQDFNGDGFVQDVQYESDRVYLDPFHPKTTHDEFIGFRGAEIVGYMFPGQLTRDSAPYWGSLREDVTPGLYFGDPASVLGFPYRPGYGILQTMGYEIIALPSHTPDGATGRIYERDPLEPNSLIEVDVFKSVDPALETLYLRFLKDGWFTITNGTLNTGIRFVNGAIAGDYDGTRRFVGPARSQVVGRADNENGQRPDYAFGPHTFLDAVLAQPNSYSPGAGLVSSSHGHDCASVVYPGLTRCRPSADGTYRPLNYASANAVFGVWWDKNADGWIGDAMDAVEGCEGDPYACGSRPDPNDYRPSEEFTPYCLVMDGIHEVLDVQVLPDSPLRSWGRGVYVLRDQEAENGGTNPYDDVVLDVTDLRIDRFHASGAIDLHLRCQPNASEPRHPSDELLVFADGQFPYDIIVVTEFVEPDFEHLGLTLAEMVVDVDRLCGWQSPRPECALKPFGL